VKKRLWIILGALFVGGLVIAGILCRTFPMEMNGRMALNYLRTLSTPAGTVSTEANPAYKGAVASASAPPPADSAWPNAAAGDWPSYNRTPSSQRYSPLTQITTKNVGKLKVLCTYDTDEFTSFESSLIMVDNALIGATEYDIFSLNSADAENARYHSGANLQVRV
jgi:alcohol dehydrogenase (cytochrome c)